MVGVILAIVGFNRVGLVIGAAITVSVGTVLATHWNDVRTFAECLDAATTDAARDTCAQQFSDALD